MAASEHHPAPVPAHPDEPVHVHDRAHHDHDDDHHHGPTVKMYVAIFLALCVLTVATVLAAKVDFALILGNPQLGGFINNAVALGIATTKAGLVVLFFMHVKYENKLVGLAVISSVIWLCFLIIITVSDYLTRTSDWHLFN